MDAVGDEVDTHVHVDHSAMVAPQTELPAQVHMLLQRHMASDPEWKVSYCLLLPACTVYNASLTQAHSRTLERKECCFGLTDCSSPCHVKFWGPLPSH